MLAYSPRTQRTGHHRMMSIESASSMPEITSSANHPRKARQGFPLCPMPSISSPSERGAPPAAIASDGSLGCRAPCHRKRH
eukprot:6187548-Pleurochrysis_carterae.AAC.1